MILPVEIKTLGNKQILVEERRLGHTRKKNGRSYA
jgi:hypothetical protein